MLIIHIMLYYALSYTIHRMNCEVPLTFIPSQKLMPFNVVNDNSNKVYSYDSAPEYELSG